MAQVLHDEFLVGRERLVVAGTHGKTTTSSLLAWLFAESQRAPSFLIGGIPENFGSSFALGTGGEFIIEGDEYDTAFFDKGPKFLHYFPDAAILTSVEFDHADIYKDLDEVKTAFKRLVNLIPKRGVLIAWDGHPNVDECVSRALCRVERYGFGEKLTWRIVDVDYSGQSTRWKLLRSGVPWADLETQLAGEYNVLNATAAAAMAANYRIPADTVGKALRSFRSVKRRLEVKSEVHGITIIDDFAHHPTAIAGTLQALRTRYSGRRLWAILEPRSNTLRRKIFETELADSLSHADQIVLAGAFKSDAIPEAERLNPENVVARLIAGGKPARLLASADAIVEAIAPELHEGDVVAILSNGGFGDIYEKLPAKLKALHEVSTPA
jgi:UDP-N-acetylmuramate: L-alanyl-gamma-D-glutamyl-meso-diaminopimelate ligase